MVVVWIAVAAGIVWLGVRFQRHLMPFLCVVSVLLPFLYIMVCVLYPSWGDTKCPKCGKAALQRPDKSTPVGVVCTACGFRDDDMYRPYLNEMY